MSLGPTANEEIRVSRFDRLNMQAKKMIEAYFVDPLHYLFYGTLGFTILGLFFGMQFSWQFYTILIILAGIKIYNFYHSDAK